MNLSIVILFCDKDVKYLKDMLFMIDKHIKCSHETILVDNRENNKEKLPTGNYKLIQPGYNTYLFEGRRIGAENSLGKYIWNVDVDDEIIGDVYDKDFSIDADILQWYYETDRIQPPKPGTFHGNPKAFGSNVWSRFYKTESIKKIYSKIKKGIKLVNYEDEILLDLMLDNYTSVYFIDRAIYKYITERSCEAGTVFNKERMEHLFTGSENLEYLCSFIKNGDKLLEKFKLNQERIKQRV